MQTIFRNIGTPSFRLSQIPQQYLQNLTPAQLQMIQQRHQQLLYSRMQQQQQMQSQQQNMQQGNNNSSQNSTPNTSNVPLQQNQQQQQQQQQQQHQHQQHQNQQQHQQHQHQHQQNNMQGGSPMNQPPNQGRQRITQEMPSRQSVGKPNMSQPQQNSHVPPPNMQNLQQNMPLNNAPSAGMAPILPPQIAQLPLTTQQQVLQTLKQQAIAKNNPAVVAAITAAENHVKQLLEEQGQQSSGNKSQSKGTQQVKNKSQMPPQQAKVPPPAIATPKMPQLPLPQDIPPPQIDMSKYQLPSFQSVIYDPPETKIPNPTYWSSKELNTDVLLYEQIIQRDKANATAQIREMNGYDPFSIYGFSNKEYVSKLWHALKYYQDLKTTRMKSITNTSQNIPSASIWGNGYSGYGNGNTNTTTKVIPYIPVNGREFYSPDKIKVYKQAMHEESEDLVPIRLEFDLERDKFFLRDTFLWNRNESVIDIDDFVEDMVKDYQFPNDLQKHVIEVVSQSMKEQIQEYQPDPFKIEQQPRIGGDDMRITIRLDIVVGQSQLIDQFEWDISNPDNCPEEFAENMCRELELPGEFISAIAHSIREQVHMYHKSLMILGYNFDGGVVEDDDVRSRILPVVTVDDVYRIPADTKVFTPNILQISPAELERLDKDKERDTRRKRRQGRFSRRGNVNISSASLSSANVSGIANNASGSGEVTLPDIADVPRTFRTPVPSSILPGGVDLGPSVYSYDLKTSVEFRPRPERPKPVLPPCYVVDHIPGKSMLVSIKLSAPDQDREQRQSMEDVNMENSVGFEPVMKSESGIPPFNGTVSGKRPAGMVQTNPDVPDAFTNSSKPPAPIPAPTTVPHVFQSSSSISSSAIGENKDAVIEPNHEDVIPTSEPTPTSIPSTIPEMPAPVSAIDPALQNATQAAPMQPSMPYHPPTVYLPLPATLQVSENTKSTDAPSEESATISSSDKGLDTTDSNVPDGAKAPESEDPEFVANADAPKVDVPNQGARSTEEDLGTTVFGGVTNEASKPSQTSQVPDQTADSIEDESQSMHTALDIAQSSHTPAPSTMPAESTPTQP